MSFGFLQVTAKGRALLARAQIGTATINFTHIKMGDGEMSGQVIDDMTALINLKKELDIRDLVLVSAQQAKVQSVFTNQGLATGFYWREVGVFATDPNDNTKEIMYCYGNAGGVADYIPAEGSQILERVISILTIISNAQSVSATIEESLVYSLKSETDAHANNATLHLAANIPLTSYVLPATGGAIATTDTVNGAIGKLEFNSNAHLADYVAQPANGGTTGGTSIAYTCTSNPAPASLVDKIGVVVTIHLDSGTNPTLNWNGKGAKPIKKANGNPVILKQDGIYTFRYNATTENFILQGEGGDLSRLPNLIKDGSFENGINCWVPPIQGYGMDISQKKFGTQSLGIWGYVSSSKESLIQNFIPYIQGHKYYVRYWVMSRVAGKTSQLIFPLTASNPYVLVTCAAANTWYVGSFISDEPSIVSGNYSLRVDNNNEYDEVTMLFDGIMLLDLTEGYGAGNEPIVSEVDEMVVKNGGWWDSDLTALTSDTTALAKNIATGLTAYANGIKLIGTNASAVDLSAGTNVMYTDAVSKVPASTSYIEAKAVTINKAGTYRVSFTMGTTNTSNTIYGKIYVNGVAVGTERVTNLNSDTIYTEDISLNVDDRLSIRTKYSPAATGTYLKDFIIKANLASIYPTAALT